jgi:phosphodiesterase/alkaline phosphatase D-like protein
MKKMKHGWLLLVVAILSSCTVPEKEPPITHGPMLGRLEPNSIGIWARTRYPGEFRVRYGTSPDRLDLTSDPIATRLGDDHTGWAMITGLEADTRYYYVLVSGTEQYPGGSFRTLPSGELYRDDTLNPEGLFNFSFEFACGNNQAGSGGSGTSLPTFRTISDQFADRIYFSIQNGDWLYEADREFSVDQWREQTGTGHEDTPRVIGYMPAITGVWQNYKGYLERGANLAEFHRNIPCFYTFDDHEILNDVIGTGETGHVNRRAVFRDIALKAWEDYLGWSNPSRFGQEIIMGRAALTKGSRILVDPEADFLAMDTEQQINLHVHWGTADAGVNDTGLDTLDGDPNAGVYEILSVLDRTRLEIHPPARAEGESNYSIGRHSFFRKTIGNCDFFYLDTRSNRHVHDHLNPGNPDKSMLGKKQLDWLLNGVEQSKAAFIFIVSSVNFMIPHVSGGAKIVSFKDDAWTAFIHERKQLISNLDGIEAPVFILTGDLHNSFAIKITDNLWEFASGPRNSRNHKYTDEGSRPASGIFTSIDRDCEIRWSTWFLADIPYANLLHPHFCVVKVNNVFNSPMEPGGTRYVAFERPQVIFQYYNGKTGELVYAESVTAGG